ncbi:MAG: HAD hydrolase family protein [Verrucomicrobia bacterium]|nr:HAD hydrolase family protein [Verrucomicrobiota bacterium]
MSLEIRIVSTDFDGTLYAEFETPPVPHDLQSLIGQLQRSGTCWVINTGRELDSLVDMLERARLTIQPDYVVAVEREIFQRQDRRFVGLEEWNRNCRQAHECLFERVSTDLPRIIDWLNTQYTATIYADAYSPFCLLARNNDEADAIQEYLDAYCRLVPKLTLVRNDVYARLSHADYNKGTALAEITRQLGASPDTVFAAGDQFNDLPMLSIQYARCLAAPANAIPAVKAAVLRQQGYISDQPWGHGVARGLEHFLAGSRAVSYRLDYNR